MNNLDRNLAAQMHKKPSYAELEQRIRDLEESIDQKNHLINDILNYIPDLIFVKDVQHRWVLLNDAFCAALGHRREELIGKTDYDIHPKEEADVFWEKDNIVFQTDETNINEEVYTDHKGDLRAIQTSKTAFRDKRGKKFLVGIARDITARKRIEKQIEIEKKFSEGLINSLPGIMYVFDQFGRLRRWNKNFEKVSGYSPARIAEMNPLDFIASEDKARVSKAIEKVFNEDVAVVEAGFTSIDGQIIPYHLTGYKFVQEDLNYLVGIGIDISGRIKIEKEKENLINRLQETLSQVKQLSGFLPICASCKKIRDDKGYWNQIESYIKEHSEVDFSHSICPDCARKIYPDLFK